jgi:hypothetical protein
LTRRRRLIVLNGAPPADSTKGELYCGAPSRVELFLLV